MTHRLSLAALLGTLLAAPAIAGTGSDVFQRLDRDRDGVVSRAEFRAFRLAMFDRIDTDADGLVTAGEIEAARGSLPADRGIWSQDADGDDRLSPTEYVSRMRGFDRADRNRDGAVSAAEFSAAARYLAALKH
ncbi:MAG: EF-hand domain-containing protein [Rhodobacteraceae bacterium]|nr:EF-hand domain-containing protein [Paracoccaceae bacterium]